MASSSKILVFDTDVLANVLLKEKESVTEKDLWQAPLRLFEMVENNLLTGKCPIYFCLVLQIFFAQPITLDHNPIFEFFSCIYPCFFI
jgi:hypothetical protein